MTLWPVPDEALNAVVVPNDPGWALQFAEEAARLRAALRPGLRALHHIGSTSVPGLMAKPILDMMAEVADLAEVDAQTPRLSDLGYEPLGAYGIPGRRYFRKVTPEGRRTHQLHVFATGSAHLARHLALRDYLRAHPPEAEAYGALKLRLIAQGKTGWQDYLDGKAEAVAAIEQRALGWVTRHANR